MCSFQQHWKSWSILTLAQAVFLLQTSSYVICNGFALTQVTSVYLALTPLSTLANFVTITTYTYLHLENKRTHVSPTFFVPIFVHAERNFETYYHLFTTLLKLEPKLAEICAAGSDSEEELIKAFRTAFHKTSSF